MSRAIQIRVSESVVRTVHVEDGVQTPLEVLPILAPARMGELLADQLRDLGFVREADTMTRTDADGIEISIDLATATVTARVASTAEVAAQVARAAASGEANRERTEQALRASVHRELDRRIEARTEALRREATRVLEDKLGDLHAELDGAVGRATIAALTEKAASLGHIESVVTDEAGNVAIKVKL